MTDTDIRTAAGHIGWTPEQMAYLRGWQGWLYWIYPAHTDEALSDAWVAGYTAASDRYPLPACGY